MKKGGEYKIGYIYRYVLQNEVIYIGKTKRDLYKRINEHKLERKFMPYLAKSKIEYYETNTDVEMDIHEKYWINVYMPKLNVVDKEGAKFNFSIGPVRWKSYEDYYFLDEKDDFELTTFENEKEKISEKRRKFNKLESDLAVLYNAEEFIQYLLESFVYETIEFDGYMYSLYWDLDKKPLPDNYPLFTRAEYDKIKKEYKLYIHKSLFNEIKLYISKYIKNKIIDIRAEELTHYLEFCT